jgi:hypothetical protein
MAVQILSITGKSDGDGRRRPRTNDFTRNDQWWLERIATEKWAKDRNLSLNGVTYCLDRLPDGYGGYEKRRGAGGGDSKHIDRYVYGHPKGVFRSLNEFYPHFKWLMHHADGQACPCKLCAGKSSGSSGGNGIRASGSPVNQSPFFARQDVPEPKPESMTQPKQRGRPKRGMSGMLQDSPVPQRKRPRIDEDGTPDALQILLDKLKQAGMEGSVDESLIEKMSPDWRVGHRMLMSTLSDWQHLPNYVPRQGELVLFVRHLDPNETLGWDNASETYRVIDMDTRSWGDRPKWEAGVVTQMPTEAITNEDLGGVPANKQHSVVNSGFRIEPLPEVSRVNKAYSKQHKYVPLHAIRPLCLWKECLVGLERKDCHPTVNHAQSVASSMCLVGKYHFKGKWPEATVFVRGLYIGPELVMLGDAVRLHPRLHEQPMNKVTDVLVITAIKMRAVDLDEASEDDDRPYTTCIHISGKGFTQQPGRSFDGIGKVPIPSDSEVLPPALRGIGAWYHMSDPKKTNIRIEVPHQRVIGRCYEAAALKTWFSAPIDQPPVSSFQAINSKPQITIAKTGDEPMEISHGLEGVLEARKYSQEKDPRIEKDKGKTWFWAETRVQQLDLHEVNNLAVGTKVQNRATELEGQRTALNLLDHHGKNGGLEAYRTARREREHAQGRRESALGASTAQSGMVAGAARAMQNSSGEGGTGGDDEEQEQEEDDEDEDDGLQQEEDAMEVTMNQTAPAIVPRRDSSSGSEMDVDAGNALAQFKKAPAPVQAWQSEVIEFASDDEERFVRG